MIAAGSRLGPSTFNSFRHPRMIDRRIIDASMGPDIFGTGRTGGNMGPEIFGTGSERVDTNDFNVVFRLKHSGNQQLSPGVPFSGTFTSTTYSPYTDPDAMLFIWGGQTWQH